MNDLAIRLESRVAVVTGGGSGIGAAIVRTLASAGATVVVADLNESSGTQVAMDCVDKGGKVWFCRTDVADPESVRLLVSEVQRQEGHLDILVNNAAWVSKDIYKPFVDQPIAEWDKTHNVNFRGAMLCCKAALPLLEAARGSIIGIASVGASVVFPDAAAYCSSKSALQHFIKALALEYGAKGVRANVVAPGWIDTPGVSFATDDLDAVNLKLNSMVPLRRLGKPQEVANVVAFLASDLASYVTGSVYGVDGGWLLQ